ncbi:tetratricopeptide repeat protein [Hahella aquimaris]|uniref:tetratricopeptide repeat protein n=1 Tax=Hahella sp. HNIBRBA332 TaxID=3015983 RepID=UPI00273B1D6E|nr:tetratricopeptide repeat protein [Hahella sp. HNIBRBA332]WLQ16168.1 tetratricopeptide repeat protein [Hahella sp. HNIBRBA332]
MKQCILFILMTLWGTAMAADIVYKSADGRVLTLQELENSEGKVAWEVQSGQGIPEAAVALHNQGREFGQQGENDKAIDAFTHAIKLAPDWPYPYYDLAYTYLLAGDPEQALAQYKTVNQLSPRGFFTAQTAYHYLQLEKEGAYPAGLYLYYLSHEWGKSPEQQTEIFTNILNRFPDYAPALQKLAGLYDDGEKKLALIDKGLAANPDKETRGFLLLNKAVTLYNSGDGQTAITILGELALDPESPMDVELIAQRTLAMLVKQQGQ